jgi:hypothetical protein
LALYRGRSRPKFIGKFAAQRALLSPWRIELESAFWTKNHPSFRKAMRQAPRLSRASARDNDEKLQRKSER